MLGHLRVDGREARRDRIRDRDERERLLAPFNDDALALAGDELT